MNELNAGDLKNRITRRDFVIKTAVTAPVIAFPSISYAGSLGSQSQQKIRLGLIGCGGRGTHDTINCLNAAPGLELVAMADLFRDQLDKSYDKLKQEAGEKVNVPDKNKFTGFDAYKGVLAGDADLVLLTATPHFRPRHLEAAVEAGKHIFMEKPVAVDPVGIRSVIASSEKAEKKGLTIVGGTQGRKDPATEKVMDMIHDGVIGDLVGDTVIVWVMP